MEEFNQLKKRDDIVIETTVGFVRNDFNDFKSLLGINSSDILKRAIENKVIIAFKYSGYRTLFEYRYDNDLDLIKNNDDYYIAEFLLYKKDYEQLFQKELEIYEKYKGKKTISDLTKDLVFEYPNLIQIDSKGKETTFIIQGSIESSMSYLLLLKKDDQEFFRSFMIFDDDIKKILKKKELKINSHLRDIINEIEGSASTGLSYAYKMYDRYKNSKFKQVFDNGEEQVYQVDEDMIEVKGYRCAIDDYAVDIKINGIELHELEGKKNLKGVKIHQDGTISCVPYCFKDDINFKKFSIPLPFNVVKKLDVHKVKDGFMILGKSIKYDKELGLII